MAARLHGLDVMSGGGAAVWRDHRYSGVVWIKSTPSEAAGVTDTREDALTYLTHHVGNRLDRAKAEAFVDSTPTMLDRFEREGIAAFTLALTWADYHPDEPGGSQGGRSLVLD
jgi:hypothetical protein